MQNNRLELVFILDESGSMASLTDDTIGSFNSNLSAHKTDEGDVLVTTVLFSSGSETIHDRIPIADVPPLTEKEYRAGGNTALYDAIGKTVRHIEDVHRYIRPEDVPDNVLFIIITDGMENSSREYSGSQVREMVKTKKEAGWDFLFIGADIDAAAAAEDIGINCRASVTIRRHAADISRSMRFTGEMMRRYSAGERQEYSAFEDLVDEMKASEKEEMPF